MAKGYVKSQSDPLRSTNRLSIPPARLSPGFPFTYAGGPRTWNALSETTLAQSLVSSC